MPSSRLEESLRARIKEGAQPRRRLPGCYSSGASVQVALDKARTAAIYRRPSRVFEKRVTSGQVSAMALAGATALQCGIPIVGGGRVVGAIGVIGERPRIDEDIAIAGAAAIAKAVE